MGWESFHSVWDDPVDPPAGDSQSAAKKGRSWWEDLHEDNTSSGYYGSSGSYSYKSAFDDSDNAWYKKNSFKYGGYSDYSPSSLFRSSFVGFRSYSSYYGGDNEAKNKAVRALRTLTRNANTLVDAAKKINYDVQFSSGTDSNGVSAALSSGKKQIIYVSPDKLVETKTTDEEDAVIDALTGFVLLRVQLSQTVPEQVVTDINKLSVVALPMRLAEMLQLAVKSSASAEEAAPVFAANFMDEYLAGMLAKSLLTRICRRKVVEDWGGFAPYFVRHAKQFITTAEALEKSEPSVETWSAKIAYNMIADEAALEIDENIVTIAEKHLGAELPQQDILPACQKFVAELREYLTVKGAGASGAAETTIAEGLKEIMQRQKEAAARAAEKEALMRENMENLATIMDDLHSSDSATRAPEHEAAMRATAEMLQKAREVRLVEQLLNAVKDLADQKEKACADSAPAGTIAYIDRMLMQNVSHYSPSVEQLARAGVDQNLVSAASHADKSGLDRAKAQFADWHEYVKRGQEHIREEVKKLKAAVTAGVKPWLNKLADTKEMYEQFRKRIQELRKNLESALEEHDCDAASGPLDMLSVADMQLRAKLDDLDDAAKAIAPSKLTNIRAPSGIQTACSSIYRKLEVSSPELLSTLNSMTCGVRDAATREFARDALNGLQTYENEKDDGNDEAALSDWHKPAIDRFVARKMLTESGFKASAMNHANKDLFDQLRDLFKETGIPSSPHSFEANQEQLKEQLENLARSMGMSLQELLSMLRLSEDIESSGKYDVTDAKQLGEMVSSQFAEQLKGLTAVDEQLFGGAVEKRTTVLDEDAVRQLNDEARNLAEEEFVAYLSHNAAKPGVWTKKINAHKLHIERAKRIRNENKTAIERIRNALCFQGTKRTGEVHGLLSGDLDEGSLHKLMYDSEHIWSQKEIVKLPDVAVGILVDQSGSMHGTKIEQAREICILLAEALKRIEGMHLHVYGHSANMRDTSDMVLFEHYSSTGSASTADLDKLGSIEAHANNYDGYAIKEAAKRLNQDPAKKKYLFVIADGLPHGTGYAGEDAQKHVTSVCSFVRNRLKIPVYAFAVGVQKHYKKDFESQYGSNHVVFLDNVRKCLPQIVRFLHNALQKEKNLVGVEAD